MVNKVILIGFLGQDPEIRDLENNTLVAKLNVATSDGYKDKNGDWQSQTEWHTVVAWRYLAEKAEQQLKKGSKVYIMGKLTTRKWQDKEGNTRYTTEVLAKELKSLDKRESNGAFPSIDNAPPAYNKPAEPAAANADVIGKENEGDLPF